MKFDELLNKYIDEIGVTAKEVSEISGLGGATISRYRSGERVPNNLETIKKIADALANLSNGSFNGAELLDEFLKAVPLHTSDNFPNKFSELLDALDIKGNKLADYMNYNPSMISRIRGDKMRIPGDFDR